MSADADGDGWTLAEGDCDDANEAIHPGAEERCNDADDDCDGTIDGRDAIDAGVWIIDGDGDGFEGTETRACTPPEGAGLEVEDCDDTDPSVHPTAEELCDGFDQDCDGVADEDPIDPRLFWADADGDGYGDPSVEATGCVAPSGYVDNAEDCDDQDPEASPDTVWYADDDGDGWGAAEVSGCEQPSGTVDRPDDCDDDDAWVHPEAIELCNDADDDCDGQVDEEGIGGWRQAEDLPAALASSAVGATDEWLYVFGGASSGWANDNRTILKVDPDTLTGWTTAGEMPAFSINHGVTIHDGHVYFFGLFGGSHVGTIQANGDITDWSAGQAPPSNGENPGVAVLQGRLYVFGARSGAVAFAPLNGDGTWASWTVTTPSPVRLAANQTSFVYQDRLWVVGSYDDGPPQVYVAEADGAGALTWTLVTELPIRPHSSARVGDLLVTAFDESSNPVLRAAPMTGGGLGAWEQLPDIPGPTGSMFIGGDRLVQVGGNVGPYVGGTEVWVLDVCD